MLMSSYSVTGNTMAVVRHPERHRTIDVIV